MPTTDEFLTHLWTNVINPYLHEGALDNIIQNCKRDPDGPFADTGPALERILALGVSREDLALVLRSAAYEAAFGTLFALNDPGLDEDAAPPGTLYDSLLSADPSGMEGRPGSADAVPKA